MSDNEIVRSYNEAKNKDKQIGILCDLTQRKKEDIINVLKAGGAVPSPDVHYVKGARWTPERDAQLLELKKQGLTWDDIAKQIGGNAKAVSMHYYSLTKPKHTPQSAAEPVKEVPLPVENTPRKTSAFGFDNLVSVLSNGDFDTVTFKNSEVTVTVRRKAT